jgi:hypothetical protein
MTMIDPGWDLWDAKRVRTALWPSTEDWPHGDELWPDVAIRPPGERRLDLAPVRASEVEPMPGALWITYWAWAVGTPFVKIGRTRYEPGRDGRWRGKAELARRRIREWATGCMYPVRLIRVHLDDSEHEAIEHALRAVARVTPQREWFDLRRL